MVGREARTEGPTIGSRFVTEYNPTTGHMRMWNEMYDHANNINRINIKNINGIKIEAPHYPLTLKEKLSQKISFRATL